MRTYHVYIMASASRVLYIGVTNDLTRRVWEHKKKRVPGFSARYCLSELVYLGTHENAPATPLRMTRLWTANSQPSYRDRDDGFIYSRHPRRLVIMLGRQ